MDGLLIFLGIVIFLIFIFVFIGNIYILAYFSHPEDKMTYGIWFYRVLVILALSFAQYLVFAIPLDLSSSEERDDSIGLGYPMDFIWSCINFLVCICVMFFLPLALIIYTNEEEGFKRVLKYALKFAGSVLTFHILCCMLYYFICGAALIPINLYSKNFQEVIKSSVAKSLVYKSHGKQYTIPGSSVEIKFTFMMCCTLHVTVLGSFLFIFMAGYGLAYAPMEYLNAFLNRPQIRDAEDFIFTKLILREENNKIINKCKDLDKKKEDTERTIGWIAQRRKRLALRREINQLKKEFMEFDEVMECFKQEMQIQDVNPLVHLTFLLVGCVGFVGSFLIIFHTLFINISNKDGQPISYLLNNMFIFFADKMAPILAIAFWLVMSFYLLICLVKGNMILNATISSFMGIHPFKINATWMSSFLINCILMLVCSMGMLSYFTNNYESWLRNTACERLFRVMFSHARYVKIFYDYKIFNLGMIACFIIVTILLLMKPSKKSKIAKIMREKKKERMEALKQQD